MPAAVYDFSKFLTLLGETFKCHAVKCLTFFRNHKITISEESVNRVSTEIANARFRWKVEITFLQKSQIVIEVQKVWNRVSSEITIL